MIIYPPKIKSEKDSVCVSAKIEFEKSISDIPDTLWFKFPKKYKNLISKSSDASVVSLIPLAMELGENIEVEGKISPRLAYSLKQYQFLFRLWHPKVFKLIELKFKQYSTLQRSSARKRNVICTFSGGVDSFYTLWSHLPQNEKNKDFQITHALCIHGWDIPLKDIKTFQTIKNSYEKLMQKLGIKLIATSTNVKEFHKTLDWDFTFPSAMLGFVHTLNRQNTLFYLPSNDLIPPPSKHLYFYFTIMYPEYRK